jgi:hypothetical protein
MGRRAREGVRVAGGWLEVRDDLFFHFLFLNWTHKWASVHAGTYRTTSALTSGFHMSD